LTDEPKRCKECSNDTFYVIGSKKTIVYFYCKKCDRLSFQDSLKKYFIVKIIGECEDV